MNYAFKRFLRSAAMGWLAFALLGVVTGFGFWIAELRIAAAQCRATSSVQGQLNTLKAAVKRDRSEDFNEIRDIIDSIDNECLDLILFDDPALHTVRNPEIEGADNPGRIESPD